MKSRFLKTNLRNLIKGDFLFVDTDTVITANLEEIDDLKANLGIVLDLHCHFSEHPMEVSIRKWIKRLYGIDLKPDSDYYNSGVMLVRDTPSTYVFFNEWHRNWQSTKNKKSGIQDQQSLAFTIDKLGGVKPLEGIYNCQVLGSIEYLMNAKIIHFFNNQWSGLPLSPFFERNFYLKIRETGITAEIRDLILHCKSSFISPSMPVGKDDMILCVSPSFKLLRLISHHQSIFTFINKVCSRLLNLTKNG